MKVDKIISEIYGIVMMDVMVGIMIKIMEEGNIEKQYMLLLIVDGKMIIEELMNNKEIGCMIEGVVY